MSAPYSWPPRHSGFYHRPRPGEVRAQQSEVRAGLDAARDGTCKPYIVTAEKHILEVVGPQRNRAQWAGIAGDKRNGYYIRSLSKNRLSSTRKPSIVPVRRTIAAALKAVEAGADRAAKRQTLHADRDALVAYLLGRSPVRAPWPSRPEDQAYVMREVLRADQDDKCAICGRPSPTMLDHDHETLEVRGLLCGMCNGDEGRPEMRDDPRFVAYRAAPPAARFGRNWDWPYPDRRPDPGPHKTDPFYDLYFEVDEDESDSDSGEEARSWR